MAALRNLLSDENGATAIEYCLLAAFIALGIITSVGEVGRNVANGFDKADEALSGDGKGNGKGKGGKKDKDDKNGNGKGPK